MNVEVFAIKLKAAQKWHNEARRLLPSHGTHGEELLNKWEAVDAMLKEMTALLSDQSKS